MERVLTRPHHFIARFFGWWFAELGALVPRRLRQPLRPGPPILVVEPSREEVTLRLFRGERRREIGRVRLEGEDAEKQRRAFDALMKGVKRAKTEIALRLPAEQALKRTLELPWVPASDLRQALFFQIDRQTPFAPEEVYFDYHVSARDPQAKRLSVEMTVVPRRVVDDAVATAAQWGLRPVIVDVAGEDPAAPPRLNLLCEVEALPARSWPRVNVLLAVVAVLLAAALVYVPMERQRTAAETLRAQVTEAQLQASYVLELRQEVERLQKDSRFLYQEKRKSPSAVVILDELTAILPDHTWLFEVRLRGREIHIAGYSSVASTLLGVIAQSPLFEAPSFRSSVTQDPRTGLERFRLSFQVAEQGEQR